MTKKRATGGRIRPTASDGERVMLSRGCAVVPDRAFKLYARLADDNTDVIPASEALRLLDEDD